MNRKYTLELIFLVQAWVARSDGTKPLTLLVASIGRLPAFGLGLTAFMALLAIAWRVEAGAASKAVSG